MVEPPIDPVTGQKDYNTLQDMMSGRYPRSNFSPSFSEESFEASEASVELSPSMSTIASKLSGFTTVNALSIVMEIMKLHNEYVGGKAAKFVKQVDASTGITKSFEEWLQEVRLLFKPERQQVLHGRLVILGLAMISPVVRSELMRENFLRELVAEYERDVAAQITEESSKQDNIVEYVLTERGIERWMRLFVPMMFDAVPTHKDDPSYVDLLRASREHMERNM